MYFFTIYIINHKKQGVCLWSDLQINFQKWQIVKKVVELYLQHIPYIPYVNTPLLYRDADLFFFKITQI